MFHCVKLILKVSAEINFCLDQPILILLKIAQVFLAKQKEITAASRNSNEEIDGINTNTIDYNDETVSISYHFFLIHKI